MEAPRGCDVHIWPWPVSTVEGDEVSIEPGHLSSFRRRGLLLSTAGWLSLDSNYQPLLRQTCVYQMSCPHVTQLKKKKNLKKNQRWVLRRFHIYILLVELVKVGCDLKLDFICWFLGSACENIFCFSFSRNLLPRLLLVTLKGSRQI